MNITVFILLLASLSLLSCKQESATPERTTKVMQVSNQAPQQPMKKVIKSDEEWRAQLTPEQYRVARQAGTEMPNSQTYKEYKKQGAGTYYCACCDAKLFHSKTKINANCGWPAFFDAAAHENIKTKEDNSGGMKRVEVLCAKCDAHLGHVFEGEGYKTPTDLRYCINGVILKFVPDSPEPSDQKTDQATSP